MIDSSSFANDAIWVLLTPPIITGIWYLLSRTRTNILGTTNRPTVRGWMRSGTWIIMGLLYIIGVSFFVYAHFIKG